MRIGVIGSQGVVGSACSAGFERIGHTVFRHDLVLRTTVEELVAFEPQIVFICVPTPSLEDGSCDLRTVRCVVDDLTFSGNEAKKDFVIAIKSTCPPGTTAALAATYGCENRELCFVPEFLRERSAFSDFVNDHDLLAIGLVKSSLDDSRMLNAFGLKSNKNVEYLVREAHGKLPKKTVVMSSTEAELLKYYSNCFNATRVTFANVFYELAQKVGADYNVVKSAFIDRGTATDLYLDVNENFRGYGGPCLPKEVKALRAMLLEYGLSYSLFEAIDSDNSKFKVTVPDGMRS